MKTCEKGQSIIEVIVATAATVLIVMGLIVGTTASLRNSQISRQRAQANKYAQEGIELVRKLRDNGWTTFATYTGTYCIDNTNAFPANFTKLLSGSCPVNITDPNLTARFVRVATISWSAPRMQVTVDVSWTEGSLTRESTLTTYFTQWRN